jgi:hypothetical protein
VIAVVTVAATTRHTCEARGSSRAVLRLLARAGVPRMFDYSPPSGEGRCWTFPRGRLGDVLAAGEVTRGIQVQLLHEQVALL